MTFEQILPALKQGKRVRRTLWDKNIYLWAKPYTTTMGIPNSVEIDPCYMTLWQGRDQVNMLGFTSIFADDWEVCNEENQPDKSGVPVGGLVCKVTANFDECEQALDKFRCRLEDLREAVEELNGLKLDINIDFD